MCCVPMGAMTINVITFIFRQVLSATIPAQIDSLKLLPGIHSLTFRVTVTAVNLAESITAYL